MQFAVFPFLLSFYFGPFVSLLLWLFLFSGLVFSLSFLFSLPSLLSLVFPCFSRQLYFMCTCFLLFVLEKMKIERGLAYFTIIIIPFSIPSFVRSFFGFLFQLCVCFLFLYLCPSFCLSCLNRAFVRFFS